MIDYITANEAASKWGISHRRVITLCSENRIENVAMLGNMWIIPANAEKPVDGRSLRYEKKSVAKPFVKWAGGKGQLLSTIKTYYPDGMGTEITKYCEPMVGAGAVLFDIINNYNLDEILICDSNIELINTYSVIQENVSDLIELLSHFEKEYLNLDEESRKEYYYSKRELYNHTMAYNVSNSVLRAALFIYLNKTCFNGLYRVNRNGQYNVPIGSYKKPTICDADNLLSVSDKLANVEIISGDYTQVNDFVDSKTFIYFDPPYRPISKTSAFTAYTENDFDDNEQMRLAEFINSLSEKGAKVLTSNSDPKNCNPNDDFFEEIYSSLKVNQVNANRAINSNGKNRGKVSELLICNY